MRQLRLLHARALPSLGLLLALLFASLLPVAPIVSAQPGVVGPAFASPGAVGGLITPDLSAPQGPAGGAVAAEVVVLQEVAGMRHGGGGAPLDAQGLRFPPRAAGTATLQQELSCEPMLSNSTLDEGYDWTELYGEVYTETNPPVYYSAPNPLWMRDTSPENEVDETPAYDAFGQDFIFPDTAQGALVEFQVAYALHDAADAVYYEFYWVDPDGLLEDYDDDPTNGITAVGTGTVEGYVDNDWHYVADYVTNSTIISAIQGQRVALVLRSQTDVLAPFEEVFFDNIQVTTCSSTTLPQGQISGVVSQAGRQPETLGDALVVLAYGPAGEAGDVARVAFPEPDGGYSFNNLAEPESGWVYQVWFINTDATSGRLSYWSGPLISAFSAGAAAGGDFDLGDVALTSPAHYQDIAFPATFRWASRGVPGDSYYLCIYEADTFSEVCTTQPTTGNSYTIQSAAVLQGIPGFSFAYGKTYGWYVRVAGPVFDTKSFAHLGASGFSQFVGFVQQTQTQPPPPQPEPPLPSDPNPDRDSWTVMFYIAGDDELLSHPAAGARGMGDIVTGLNVLAERYPTVNIVALFDLYETVQKPLPAELKGTQFCYFDPNKRRLTDNCQQRGEQNTGSEATLSGFINEALQKYPAQHTMLVIMGHGSTVSGVAGDETTQKTNPNVADALSAERLEAALTAARLNEPARKLDVLVFYSCLMGSYETAALVSPFADYLVASPNITTLIDINSQILARAQANPTNPRAVASGIVQDYDAALSAYNQRSGSGLSVAMAAYDLGKVAALRPQVESLAAALRDNLGRTEVQAARAEVQTYDSSAPVLWGTPNKSEDGLVDLRHLAARLITKTALPATVRNAAQGLETALAGSTALVIARVAKPGRADLAAGGTHILANSLGLAAYFPNNSPDGNQPAQTRDYLRYYRQTSLRTSLWIELVDATRTGLPSLPRRGSLTSGGAGAGNTLQNFVAPELFPVASAMPASSTLLYLPLLRK